MFKEENFMGKRVLTSSVLDEGVTAFFTTRDLPLKAGEREDLKDEIEQNKKLLCRELGIPIENLIIPVQTHSDNVVTVNGKQETENRYDNVDALITNQPNIALALNFADCVPIILYDSEKKVIAIAHAGWRGTASIIVQKTVQKMVEEFKTEPENIIALIGPCIGPCCFEVKEDVKETLLGTLKETEREKIIKGAFVDLKKVNELQLLDSGVIKIDVCEYCTSCQTDLFFSYRKENGHTARHSAVIMLK